MSKSNKYLEKISLVEYTEFGETMESVGMADAIIACDIRELETLERTGAGGGVTGALGVTTGAAGAGVATGAGV